MDLQTDERVHPNRCWIDGFVRCPYGSPEGQYILRPRGFCTTDICLVYHEEVPDDDLPLE